MAVSVCTLKLSAELFLDVEVGEQGNIDYQPVLMARLQDRLFFEVHGDVYKRRGDPLTAVRAIAEQEGLIDSIDWARVDAIIEEKAGIARDVMKF